MEKVRHGVEGQFSTKYLDKMIKIVVSDLHTSTASVFQELNVVPKQFGITFKVGYTKKPEVWVRWDETSRNELRIAAES